MVGESSRIFLVASETAGSGKSAVHQDDAGPELASETNGFIAVGGLSEDRNIRLVFEHAPEAAAHEVVVVDQQHGNVRWHANPAFRGAEHGGEPEFRLVPDGTGR